MLQNYEKTDIILKEINTFIEEENGEKEIFDTKIIKKNQYKDFILPLEEALKLKSIAKINTGYTSEIEIIRINEKNKKNIEDELNEDIGNIIVKKNFSVSRYLKSKSSESKITDSESKITDIDIINALGGIEGLFNREINVLKKIFGYKYFPYLLCIDRENKCIYMTFCGKSLNKNNIPVDWMDQIIDCIQIFNQEKIYHNDLWSPNILVLNNVIKIIDFGFSSFNNESFPFTNLEKNKKYSNFFDYLDMYLKKGVNKRNQFRQILNDKKTSILYKKIFNESDKEIIYSIIIPVYNQENIFVNNLISIIEKTHDNFEIIIILDFCFDNTEKNLMNFIETYVNKLDNFIQITIFKNNDKPLFETKCDNIGFKNSIGKYCLEIQADMKMTENGYNLELTKPFKLLNNVIAVSGRCTHNLFVHDGIGKLGHSIEKTVEELKIARNKFYVYETCNRGPLLLDRNKLKELNYLDEENYFLDNSDHDLMARAYLEKKYICGYVPINFYSPISEGSTRNNKNYNNCKEYLINKKEKIILQYKTNSNPGLNKYISIWNKRSPIIYNL
jgi:hypothetical protein